MGLHPRGGTAFFQGLCQKYCQKYGKSKRKTWSHLRERGTTGPLLAELDWGATTE